MSGGLAEDWVCSEAGVRDREVATAQVYNRDAAGGCCDSVGDGGNRVVGMAEPKGLRHAAVSPSPRAQP